MPRKWQDLGIHSLVHITPTYTCDCLGIHRLNNACFLGLVHVVRLRQRLRRKSKRLVSKLQGRIGRPQIQAMYLKSATLACPEFASQTSVAGKQLMILREVHFVDIEECLAGKFRRDNIQP